MATISDDIRYFARCFSQGILTNEVQSLDELADSGLKTLPRHFYPTVARFIDDLLAGNRSDAEILAAWDKLPSDLYFGEPQGLIEFLKILRAKISRR